MEAYMVRREVSAFAVVRAVLEGLWSCNTRLAGVHSVAKIDLDVGKIVGTITSAKVRTGLAMRLFNFTFELVLLVTYLTDSGLELKTSDTTPYRD